MVVARASGTDLASSLKQNTFLTLGVCPAGGPAGTGGHAGAPGRGATQGPGPETDREGTLASLRSVDDRSRGYPRREEG